MDATADLVDLTNGQSVRYCQGTMPTSGEQFSQAPPQGRRVITLGAQDELARAFEEIEREYRAYITHFLLRRTGDVGVAEELSQETFLRAWKTMGALSRHPNPLGWLTMTAKHQIADHYRKKLAKKRDGTQGPISDSTEMDADEAERVVDDLMITHALQSLSDDHRHIVDLCILQGFSTSQAANALDIPLGTVKSRLYYALSILRHSLSGMRGEHS